MRPGRYDVCVLPNTYESQNCSMARALEVVGERWTLLILRDVFLGIRRFDDLAEELGVTRSVLSARLGRLVEEGVLEKHRYQERPERFEYRLTDKGRDLWPVAVALLKWGDKHYAPPAGPPRLLLHRDCGGEVDDRRRCARCGRDLDVQDITAVPGPDELAA
jgi:DNA-binding HxlR family transcriptional regulator